jgi:hypothetical protein
VTQIERCVLCKNVLTAEEIHYYENTCNACEACDNGELQTMREVWIVEHSSGLMAAATEEIALNYAKGSGGEVLGKYTPSPAPPTRSDTREQAAASPSAVGEGQTITEWFATLRTDIARELPCSCDEDETCFRCLALRRIDGALSSQAPKPASAGGEPESYERKIARLGCRCTRPDARACASDRGTYGFDCTCECHRAIAAEADTAEENDNEIKRGMASTDPSVLANHAAAVADMGSRAKVGQPPTSDRLAPIEARGVLETIRFHLRRGDHVGADGQRCTQQLLDAIDKALRARESAPAVESADIPTVYVESSNLDAVLHHGASQLTAYKPDSAMFMSVPLTVLYATPPSVATGCAVEADRPKLKVGDEVTWWDNGQTKIGKIIAAERETEYTVVSNGSTRQYYGDDDIFSLAADINPPARVVGGTK